MTEPASVIFLCPACEAQIRARDLEPVCTACGARIRLSQGGGFPGGGPITRCAACRSEALFRAKDFNKNLGLAIVALGCIGFWWGALTGIATLLALTVADRIVYHLRPEVTVCYACKSVYRDAALNPKHVPYELTYDETFEGTGEKALYEGGVRKVEGKS